MSQDDKPSAISAKVQRPDTRLIELDSRGEIDYWLKIFNTTQDELLAAISEVGPYAGAVDIHLRSIAAKKSSHS